MINNSLGKSKDCLQADSFDVIVVKDPEMRPFLNVFHATGQNIQQQRLGKIFGIIQIDDTSESSAYLPNMLTQIVKKEYFKNKNSDCGRSFESALHKINLALTELTQHEIIKWMNNLNAVIGVICGNEIHFTQIGRGRILFIKNEKLSIIGNASNTAEDYHPMKTFSSISAGKVGNNNKIIFTLKETFDTLKEEELERHIKTFNSSEFDNIISSTLRNEASNTGMVVINIKNQMEEEVELILESDVAPEIIETNLNFFGETESKKNKEIKKEEKIEEIEESQEKPIRPEDPAKSPFENEPEIFFKEDDEAELPDLKKENNKRIEEFKKIIIQIPEKISFFIKNKVSIKTSSIKEIPFKELAKKSFDRTKEFTNKIDWKKISKIADPIVVSIKKIDFKKIFKIKDWIIDLIQKIDFKKIKKVNFSSTEKINLLKNWLNSLIKNKNTQKFISKIGIETNFEPKKTIISKATIKAEYIAKIKNIYGQIKTKLSQFKDNKYFKKIIIAIVVLIILSISIFFIAKNIKSNAEKSLTSSKTDSQTVNNSEEKSNIQNLKILINLEKPIKDSTFLKNDLFLLTENDTLIKFSVRDNTKTEIVLPSELKNPEYLSSIESLQIILITSQSQTYSYSPVTNSFSKNTLQIPEKFKNIGVGTYLTYLYLLDQELSQIYRYDRVPGGFGVPQKWVKEEANFQNAISMSVSDSIYIAFTDGKIQKYFKNKKEKEFNLESDFVPDEIQTKINQSELFALDKKQGKIIKLSENNNQQILFQNDQFQNAKDFSVDFENRKIFIITEKQELLMFNYNN